MSEPTVYRNALELNSTLAEYRLEAVLGVGGFGMTYLGWDNHLEKHVAIKEYLPGDLAVRALDGSVVPVSTDHQCDYLWGLERFIQEARTLARFSHPHIVRVNRYFEANGTGYMVMDYENGESLSQRLKRAPLPAEAELKRMLMPLLDGLAAVHAARFLHRDIKPSNIFIRANGSPVLLDFGAARATGGTRALTAVLTPGYAPLEQYGADGKQGPWTDIYAMAGVLFRTVTDQNPPDAVGRLQGDSVPQALAAARSRYSEPLLRAIEWALQVQPEVRPQSIADWQAVFAAQAQQRTASRAAPASTVRTIAAGAWETAARPVSLRQPQSPRGEAASRWPRLGWAALLAVAVMVAFSWYQHRPLPRENMPAAASPDPAAIPAGPTAAPAPASPGANPRARLSRPDVVPDRAREKVYDEFRRADRDGDGYLSPTEVDGRFPVLAREFLRVDRDGDGRISQDELTELRRLQFEGRRPVTSRP
ncbi:MAG: hypothetical protein EHM16_14125 [Betaproteobacteria bacterium]|nr:MAG: hypothetical protein EHM16_14125 [Betaproteobacteria bacterium]